MINQAAHLRRSFLRVVLIGALPVVCLLAVLGANDYRRSHQEVLEQHRQALVVRQAGLAQVAAGIHQHVAVMRAFLLNGLGERSVEPGGSRVRLRPVDPGPARGVLLGPDGAELSADSRAFLAASEALFPLQRAFQQAQPSLRWSYAFDADRTVIAIYPAGPAFDSADEFRSWFDYEIFRGALPESNAERRPYWTPVYIDAGGAGLMVSHGSPVDRDGRFRGMVGTDILLSSLSAYLRSFAPVAGRVLVADQDGSLVATDDDRATHDGIVKLADVAGPAVLHGPQDEFVRDGANYALRLGIAATPWQVVHVVPQASVTWTAASSLLPYLTMAGGILVSLLGLYWVLSRRFVRPAVQLAGYVEAAAARLDQPVPTLPASWQPWADRVSGALRLQQELLERVRSTESLGTAIIDAALDAVIVADHEGRITRFSGGAERIFGHPSEVAVGSRISDLIVPPALRDAHDAGMRRFRETGTARVLGRRIEIEAMRADGSLFPAELVIQRVAGDDTFAAYLRDLTDSRASAAAIERQQQHIHQIEKLSAMGSLLAGVAHELNNPLAILVAQATLLRDKATTPDVERRAERIHAAAQRAGRIVKSFLAMARQKPPQREPVQLNGVVEAALELTAYGLRSNGIEVDVALDPNLPLVEADRDLLGQVFANLLINAQQALMDRPEPRRIAVSTSRSGSDAVVVLADNGPGIPPDVAGRIYEPYFTTKAVGVGTGIGLAISRNIVEAHGGSIALDTATAEGARFRITLPLRPEIAMPAEDTPSGREDGLRVLVVDDERDVGEALAEMLEGLGHRVTVTDTPADALRSAEASRYDVVFADLRMPGLGSSTMVTRLAALDPGLGARTVIMTGDTVLGAQNAGTDLILEKPFTVEDVCAAIERALSDERF